MLPLQIVLISLGIAPSSALFLYILVRQIRSTSSIGHGTSTATDAAPERGSREAQPADLGGSSVTVIASAAKESSLPEASFLSERDGEDPQFESLRVDCESLTKAHWRLRIRFLLRNTLDQAIAVDDIHVRVYSLHVPTPPYLTISYRGEAEILQDNSMLKKDQTYSLEPGDGLEMVLVTEVARLEGAPLYSSGDHETPGPMLAVFGLLLDYYILARQTIERRVLPSDCLYFFECLGKEGPVRFFTISERNVEAEKLARFQTKAANSILASLGDTLSAHKAFRPTPRA
jgi:hypothetical protein